MDDESDEQLLLETLETMQSITTKYDKPRGKALNYSANFYL